MRISLQTVSKANSEGQGKVLCILSDVESEL